jgi:hypothetical protein
MPWLYRMENACAILYCHLRTICHYNFFSTLSHKRHEFRREVIKQEYMIFIVSKTLSDKSHILGNIERNAVINMQMCSCKLFIILTDFIES